MWSADRNPMTGAELAGPCDLENLLIARALPNRDIDELDF
jgi:hypothetical protein